MHALVCDDDAACRFVSKRLLTVFLGCAVTECEDGVAALELLEQETFDVAIIDLELPRLSGVEVVEAIRLSPVTRHMPIVILSQDRRAESVAELVALGVSEYLIKPLRGDAVTNRIGPLVAHARTRRPVAPCNKARLRVSPESPALLVDGDAHYRHFFVSVASRYGPVIEAESGASALALFRQAPAQVVFIGEGLGIVGPAGLIGKIRAQEDHTSRIVGIAGIDGYEELDESLFDTTIPRLFQPQRMIQELRPFVQVPGPLTAIEEAAPRFFDCLSSAVTQVLGMVTDEVVIATASDHDGDMGPAASSVVTIDLNGRYQLTVEIRLPSLLIRGVSAKMCRCDLAAVTDEDCVSTCGELTRRVTGRLECWLKEHSLQSACSLPDTRLTLAREPITEPPEGQGLTRWFTLPECKSSLLLSVHARDTLAAE